MSIKTNYIIYDTSVLIWEVLALKTLSNWKISGNLLIGGELRRRPLKSV
jgi:hypothetical protein